MERKFRELVNVACDIDTKMSCIEHAQIINVISFIQVWSTTALGFDYTFSGQAITPAYTTVVETIDGKYYVFFDGRFAYCVENPTEEFRKDLANLSLKSVEKAMAAKYSAESTME